MGAGRNQPRCSHAGSPGDSLAGFLAASAMPFLATLGLEHVDLLSGLFVLGLISPMFRLRPLTAVLLTIPGMDTGGLVGK